MPFGESRVQKLAMEKGDANRRYTQFEEVHEKWVKGPVVLQDPRIVYGFCGNPGGDRLSRPDIQCMTPSLGRGLQSIIGRSC